MGIISRLRRKPEALQARVAELLRYAADDEHDTAALKGGGADARPLERSRRPILLTAPPDALAPTEMLLRAMFDAALDAILLADDGGRYVDANPAACALFGLPPAELIGPKVAEFAAPGYHNDATYREFRERGHMRGQFPLQRPDGAVRVLDYCAVANVLPGMSLSVLRAVTEQIAAEAALRRSEARFRVLIEKSAEAISLTAAGGRTVYRSPPIARTLGWSPGELAGISFTENIFPEDRERFAAAADLLMRGVELECFLQFRASHRDGSVRWMEGTATNLLVEPDVGAVVGRFREITSRKRLEEAAALAVTEARGA